MKIAQINPGLMQIPPNNWGAVEKIIWNYHLEGQRKGHQVDIVYINEIRQNEYDIVHVHMWNHALEMAEKDIPYVFTFHDHHAYVYGNQSDVYKNNLLAMQRAELALVPAEYLVKYFEGIPKYLRHGIDPNEFSIGTPNEYPKLLSVGNNGMGGDTSFDRKGFRYSIEAAERLGLPITIVGPTNTNKEFFEKNSDLLKSNVTLRYDLSDSDLQEVYRSHDILIHMSSVEAGHPPLTLLEAASSGLPIITTDCGGGLYTNKVDRDTNAVVEKVNEVIKLYALNRAKTIKSVQNFHWTNVVDDLLDFYTSVINPHDMRSAVLDIYKKIEKRTIKNHITINFIDGPFVEITGQHKATYTVKFIDSTTNDVIYQTNLGNNQWARCSRKWYTDWKIEITSDAGDRFEYLFDASDKRILISLESSSLGDNLAWLPYINEFQKKHNAKVVVSTFQNELFKENYPNLEFVNPGSTVGDLYALYRLGVFVHDGNFDASMHKSDYKKLRLQELASDILGLDFKEIRPKINMPLPMKSEKPYVCIANHSTAQSKYWNNKTGWQELVDYLKSLGYEVYLLSREDDGYMGNRNPTGVIHVQNKTLEEIGSILRGSAGFVGISSGLSWLAWALEVPTVLISGCTEEVHEPLQNVYRVINTQVCNSCFSTTTFDRGDWNWCPLHKGTPRQFECTKEISFAMVKPKIDSLLGI